MQLVARAIPFRQPHHRQTGPNLAGDYGTASVHSEPLPGGFAACAALRPLHPRLPSCGPAGLGQPDLQPNTADAYIRCVRGLPYCLDFPYLLSLIYLRHLRRRNRRKITENYGKNRPIFVAKPNRFGMNPLRRAWFAKPVGRATPLHAKSWPGAVIHEVRVPWFAERSGATTSPPSAFSLKPSASSLYPAASGL